MHKFSYLNLINLKLGFVLNGKVILLLLHILFMCCVLHCIWCNDVTSFIDYNDRSLYHTDTDN